MTGVSGAGDDREILNEGPSPLVDLDQARGNVVTR
jgi:hypothetical protein